MKSDHPNQPYIFPSSLYFQSLFKFEVVQEANESLVIV